MVYFHFHCMSVCGICIWVQMLTEARGVSYPGAGVTGNCVFPSMCPGSWNWVFCSTLNHWAVTQALLLLNFSLSENPVYSIFRMFRIWSFLFTLVQGMLWSYFVSYVCLSGCVDGWVCLQVCDWGGQRLMTSIFLDLFSTLFFEMGSFCQMARLTG